MARAVVEELLAAGITDVVVCPGSRSAPLALTLAAAERRGLVRLHVRVDERSGAYLALGIARGSGRPVAVVTTSGTAAVNLHPAIVEAAYSGVPLVAVTADRPGDVRGSGANQTIDQRGLYGVDVVTWADLEGMSESATRAAVASALDLAVTQPGPIHLNVPFAEPLVTAGQHSIDAVTVRPAAASSPAEYAELDTLVPPGLNLAHGLLIAGDFDDEVAREAAGRLATAMGWPIISEPSGNLSAHPQALRHGPLIMKRFAPEVIVTVGRVGLHRPETSALTSVPVHIAVDVAPRLGRVDPAGTAAAIVESVPEPASAHDPAWLEQWAGADAMAAAAVDGLLSDDELTGPVVARLVAQRTTDDDLLVIGASWPVRHVSLYAGPLRAHCIGNRGTSGIDGVISTAWGAALTRSGGTTYALVGDLTSIYDRNGLLAAPTEELPRLTYVVIDNDGGGIFSMLEQGAPDFARDFERVFGTPHGGDLGALLAAPRISVESVDSVVGLRSALNADRQGVHVIVARCASRAREADQVAAIHAATSAS
ncbi:MAG: 2-succinyl-5-enolpyruvyl-6-hydroxy-3-cyclohexene-1-carboxylic-acid synthase [Actinomycetales bacterium mxb001]|nr:MAG: 2-succinyl-5-enolpyruvyl-6-hydroxy-3-cyclohexene-1-carboxylic-acid synthase [Actinomycetales bacterium mxb001]